MSKQSALNMMTQPTGTQITATPGLMTPNLSVDPAAELTVGPVDPPPVAPKDDLNASRLAIFAKKEAALHREREALKTERDSWQKEKEEAEGYRTKGKTFDDMRAKDPIAALKVLGFTDTEIMNFLAEGEKKEASPEDIARKIAQEEAQKIRDELKAQHEAGEKDQQEKAIARLKSDITSTIKTQADKFEYCSFEGPEAELQVYEIIVENLRENGELLDVEQAFQMAEEYYEARDKAMAGLKKRQPIPATPAAEPDTLPPTGDTAARGGRTGSAPTSNVPQPPQRPKTLTNAVAATAGATIPRRETPAEKRERLINALKTGNL